MALRQNPALQKTISGRWFPLWKRVILVGIILVMLAGCSGFSLGESKEPVTLRFLYIKGVAEYEPLAADFKREHPHITVKLEPLEMDFNGIRNLESSAEGADVIRISVSMLPAELADGFMPVDMQLSTDASFPQSDLFPDTLEALKLNGKQVGLPAGINPFVVFYSPQKFANAGIQPPPSNWTLEEFVTTAMAINNTSDALVGTDRYIYGFCSHPTFTDGAIFTYLFGGGLFDSLTLISRPTLNQRANIEALDWYARLETDFGIIPARDNVRGVGELMARSNCGFWIDWLDRANFGRIGPEDATPLPLPAYHEQFNVATLDGYFIFARSAHPDEAWQWVRFLMEQPTASGVLVPPLQSLIASQEYSGRASAATVAVARSLPPQMVLLGMEMFRNERFGRVLQLFSQATTEVFKGEKDAQSALDSAQKQAEDIFK
jgi:multiple sugar transport system substrate-binding protein